MPRDDQIISARSAHRRRYGINVQHTRRDIQRWVPISSLICPYFPASQRLRRHRGVLPKLKMWLVSCLPAVVLNVKTISHSSSVLTTFRHHFIDDRPDVTQLRRGNIT